jgi:hypothetical protein
MRPRQSNPGLPILFVLEYHLACKKIVMTKVAILPETSTEGAVVYRAVAGHCHSLANTAGGALDALTAQLPADEGGTLVIVQNHRADRFFTAAQQERLGELMERWRAARAHGASLPSSEQAELTGLVCLGTRPPSRAGAT